MSDENGNTYGGHLIEEEIFITAEVVLAYPATNLFILKSPGSQSLPTNIKCFTKVVFAGYRIMYPGAANSPLMLTEKTSKTFKLWEFCKVYYSWDLSTVIQSFFKTEWW